MKDGQYHDLIKTYPTYISIQKDKHVIIKIKIIETKIMRTNIEKLQMNNTNPLKTEGNLGSFNKAAVPALYMTPIVLHMP